MSETPVVGMRTPRERIVAETHTGGRRLSFDDLGSPHAPCGLRFHHITTPVTEAPMMVMHAPTARIL